MRFATVVACSGLVSCLGACGLVEPMGPGGSGGVADGGRSGGASSGRRSAGGTSVGDGGTAGIGAWPGNGGAPFGNGGQEASGGRANGGSAAGGSPNADGGQPGDLGLIDFLGSPLYPDSAWESGSLEDVGMSRELIEKALQTIDAHDDWEIHSFLIVRSGKLVLDRYGWNTGTNPAVPGTPHQTLPNEPQPLFSTTKSFLSALIGIALDEGFLESLTETAASFFPDYAELSPSDEKSQITIEDLLTMRSGLEFSEGEQSTFSAPDPARAMFSRAVVDLPVGTVWNYSSGGSDVLAEILRVGVGETPLEYSIRKLFGPLGIEDPSWMAGANGTNYGGFGLSLTAREMARFGEMYRLRGEWLGEQIVPADWTDESTFPRCATPWGGQYAYHFWVPDLPGFFSTLGAFGQVIYVNRELELVVVFTANMPSETADSNLRSIISDYVVPAIIHAEN